MFGTAITLLRDDDTQLTLRIVGEDEADPATGRIAWTTPVARAILGSRPGEVRELPTGTVEVVSIDPRPNPPTHSPRGGSPRPGAVPLSIEEQR